MPKSRVWARRTLGLVGLAILVGLLWAGFSALVQSRHPHVTVSSGPPMAAARGRPRATTPPDLAGGARLPGPIGTVPAQVGLGMTAAWGAQVPALIQRVAPALPDGYSLLVQSISEDGQLLLATANPPPTADGSPADEPVQVVAVALAGGQVDTIFTPADARTIPYGVHADATWIVWAQDRSYADWELYAYNRATQARKQVATAAAGGSSPHMDHGLVVWTESRPGAGGTAGGVVKLADLAGGQVTTLASDAGQPQISWPYVAWLTIADAAAQPPVAAAIVVLNVQRGTRTQLAAPVGPVEFALNQDTIAWIGAPGDRITLTNVAETFVQVLPLGGFPGAFREVTLGDRLVTWAPLDDLQVWDRRMNRLVTIAPHGAGGNFVTSGRLLWTGPGPAGGPPGDALHILDTTRLP